MEIRKATAIRNSLSRSQKREIGLAMMLLCVVLVFFLCNILALIVNILELFGEYDITWLTKINNLLVTLNSSVNFVIYCIFGDKFKRIFTNLFLSMLGRETSGHGDLLRYQSHVMADQVQLGGGRSSRLAESRKQLTVSPMEETGDITLLGETSQLCMAGRRISIISSHERAA